MRKLSSSILALGAALVAAPAGAQNITSLTLNVDTVLGGHAATAKIVLDSPAGPDGAVCEVTSLGPTFLILPATVKVPADDLTATFRIHTLPLDRAASTFVRVTRNGASAWARITVLNGDAFRTRLCVYRPETGVWRLRDPLDGSVTTVTFGEPGDQLLPADYLEGTGLAQLAVFRRRTGEWHIRGSDGQVTVLPFGGAEDIPAPADYAGTGRAQLALLRPDLQEILVRLDSGDVLRLPVPFVRPGDHPVSGNYLGGPRGQIALFRPATHDWLIPAEDGSVVTLHFGEPGDAPVPADYLGLGRTQLAVFRPSTGEWFIRADDGSAIRVPFGQPGDIPVQDDYLGLRRALLAVFRPSTREWLIRTDSGAALRIPFGEPGEAPLPTSYAPRFGASPGGM